MLQIYGSPFSSPTNKVRYTANFLNLPYEFHSINLRAGEQRTPEFLKMNPLAKIPAINDNGFSLGESNAIIRYLADKKNSALYPKDLQQRAIIDQWIDYSSHHVMLATSKIMFNTYFYKLAATPIDERSLQDGQQFLGNYLPIIEKQLTSHAFIAGQKMSLADIALIAALDVCEMIEVDLTKYPHIHAWRQKLMHETFYTKCHESYAVTFNKIIEMMS